jgi:glycosyltransferase involved in cell wall biosynthesis
LEVKILPSPRFREFHEGLKLIRQIQNVILEENIQIVHANGTGAHLFGGLAARLCKVPNLFHIHDQLDWALGLQGILNKLATFIPATEAIVVSNFAKQSLTRKPFSPKKIQVIHNAFAPDNFFTRFDDGDIKAAFEWSVHSPLVLWCGRLQRWKGTHIFVEAAAIVKKEILDARFLIVGGGLFGIESEYEKELHQLVKKLNLENEVKFTGHVNDAGRFFSGADLFVQTSVRPEPFGMVILEAMTRGKPVIATNAGGPMEIVQPNVTGLLIPPKSPNLLAEAIIQLLKDGNRRKAMGEAGRKRAENRFSIEQMMSALENLYDRILGQSLSSSRTMVSTLEG